MFWLGEFWCGWGFLGGFFFLFNSPQWRVLTHKAQPEPTNSSKKWLTLRPIKDVCALNGKNSFLYQRNWFIFLRDLKNINKAICRLLLWRKTLFFNPHSCKPVSIWLLYKNHIFSMCAFTFHGMFYASFNNLQVIRQHYVVIQ